MQGITPVVQRRFRNGTVCGAEFAAQAKKSHSPPHPYDAKGKLAGIQLFRDCHIYLWIVFIKTDCYE